MDMSILNNVKKMLGLPTIDTSFDLDVLLQINSAFSILQQMGIGPPTGFTVEDADVTWDTFIPVDDEAIFNLVKTCIFLRVRLQFDPPQTSYGIAALEKQVLEHETRLSLMREAVSWVDPDPPVVMIGE